VNHASFGLCCGDGRCHLCCFLPHASCHPYRFGQRALFFNWNFRTRIMMLSMLPHVSAPGTALAIVRIQRATRTHSNTKGGRHRPAHMRASSCSAGRPPVGALQLPINDDGLRIGPLQLSWNPVVSLGLRIFKRGAAKVRRCMPQMVHLTGCYCRIPDRMFKTVTLDHCPRHRHQHSSCRRGRQRPHRAGTAAAGQPTPAAAARGRCSLQA